MQFTKIALAVAAFCTAASAAAGPDVSRIALSAGASAVQGNYNLALRAMCTAAGGVPTSYVSGNFTTVVCAKRAPKSWRNAASPVFSWRNNGSIQLCCVQCVSQLPRSTEATSRPTSALMSRAICRRL